MDQPTEHSVSKAVDGIQQRITDYAWGLEYERLSPEAIHAAKVRIIDGLGALIGGFFGEACCIARNLAAQMPNPAGAAIIGTRMKTAPDLAAFTNAITGCYADFTDGYHWPGSSHGHPGNVLIPVVTAADYAQASGRELITGVVLGYEIYQRISDIFRNPGFDNTNFSCTATAVATSKLLKLTREQLSHAISMAVVPNVILKQARVGHLTMFYTAPSGHAGRAGIFAALLAQAGMEGPHLPFEGKSGWCDHVARKRFSLDAWGGNGTRFKILDTQIKSRPSTATAMSCIIAAEKVAPLNIKEVKHVTVEVHKYAKEREGNYGDVGELNPDSRVTAYYSIPYLVACTLMDGTVTLRSYNDSRLWNPELRALLKKIEVIENPEFTKAYNGPAQQHRMRVIVVTNKGERLVGDAGAGDKNDLTAPKSDAQIEEKFRSLTEDALGAKRVSTILNRLWHLEEMHNVAEIPPAFVLATLE